MLNTENLSFRYGDQNILKFPDIDCAADQQWLILGQSGSGKTTLLQLLAGLRTPNTGFVEIGETNITNLRAHQLDLFRGKNIGIIFQQAHFVGSLNVEENMAIAQYLAGFPVNKANIRDMLDRLNVAHKLDAKPYDLSIGEQQRVAIGRALINQPKVVLADEPTSALDDINTREVISLLKEQADELDAVLMIVTHDGRLKSEFQNTIQLN